MTWLAVSTFPGIDLLGRAFEEEGFCVVRGPDVLWGGDIRRFHPPAGRFDVVIGGPPCQSFSTLAHMVRQNGYEPRFGNLIPEFERCVAEAGPQCFVMENVRAAPVPEVEGYGVHSFLLNNRQLGEEQNRVRRWSFGWWGGRRVLELDGLVALENPVWKPAALGADGGARRHPIKVGGSGKVKVSTMPKALRTEDSFSELCRSQGLADDFDLPGFTVREKCQAVGNGVPLPMGRAIARAVTRVLADG